MKFDKGDRFFDKELFEYVEDPTIEYAESGVASQVCDTNIYAIKLML
jgi:plexin A